MLKIIVSHFEVTCHDGVPYGQAVPMCQSLCIDLAAAVRGSRSDKSIVNLDSGSESRYRWPDFSGLTHRTPTTCESQLREQRKLRERKQIFFVESARLDY